MASCASAFRVGQRCSHRARACCVGQLTRPGSSVPQAPFGHHWPFGQSAGQQRVQCSEQLRRGWAFGPFELVDGRGKAGDDGAVARAVLEHPLRALAGTHDGDREASRRIPAHALTGSATPRPFARVGERERRAVRRGARRLAVEAPRGEAEVGAVVSRRGGLVAIVVAAEVVEPVPWLAPAPFTRSHTSYGQIEDDRDHLPHIGQHRGPHVAAHGVDPASRYAAQMLALGSRRAVQAV